MELFALESDINLVDLILMKATSIEHESQTHPLFTNHAKVEYQKDEALLPSWIDFIYKEIAHKKNQPYSMTEDMLTGPPHVATAQTHDHTEFETGDSSFESGLSISLAKILHGQDPSKCFIQYPKSSSSSSSSSSSCSQERYALTDIEIFHLGLQIKYLPLYRLLQTSNKAVTTDHWQVR